MACRCVGVVFGVGSLSARDEAEECKIVLHGTAIANEACIALDAAVMDSSSVPLDLLSRIPTASLGERSAALGYIIFKADRRTSMVRRTV